MAGVLVTGGAGYIGSHAVRALLDAGHRVVVVDDMSAGHAEAVPRGVLLVQAGIHDVMAIQRLLEEQELNAVMHFAAWLAVSDSVSNPIGYYKNNVAGTLGVFDAMARSGVKHFVFSSTCAVYGQPDTMPLVETMQPRPINAYGETKLAIERALPHLERAHGIRYVALRYFNAAGAHPDGILGEDHAPEIHLIPRAIEAALDGPPLQVFGDDYPTPDGTCLRDYVHVCDLADAHVRALEALESGAASGIYNVGTGVPHSVKQVVDVVSEVVGKPVRWEIAPRRPGDPASLYAASDRLGRDLGWQCKYPELKTIVQHAWRWHQTHPHGY